jgi:hypothetical protein
VNVTTKPEAAGVGLGVGLVQPPGVASVVGLSVIVT